MDINKFVAFAARIQNQLMAIRDEALVAHFAGNAAKSFATIGSEGNSIPVKIANGVAIVTVDGVMMPDAGWYGEVSTTDLSKTLDRLAADDNVKKVVMEINSPGGAVAGHANLMDSARALASAKPLETQVINQCCSAGLWLALAGEKIYAPKGSLVGSIGVRNHVYDVSKLFEGWGIKTVDISSGPLKSLGLAGTEVTAEQKAYLQEKVDQIFEQFVSDLMASRSLTKSQAMKLATGAVWYSDADVVELNLLDGLRKPDATYAELPAPPRSSRKDLAMSQDQPVAEGPVAVTTAELKKKFPNSSAEWREEQTEAKATMADAAIAYAQFQEAEATAARTALAEATASAEAAAAAAAAAAEKPTTPPKSTRGVTAGAIPPADEDTGDVDYKALAAEYAQAKGCRYSQACLYIKKKYGEPAIEAFNGPPLRTRKAWANT